MVLDWFLKRSSSAVRHRCVTLNPSYLVARLFSFCARWLKPVPTPALGVPLSGKNVSKDTSGQLTGAFWAAIRLEAIASRLEAISIRHCLRMLGRCVPGVEADRALYGRLVWEPRRVR